MPTRSAMTELERAAAFEEELRDRCAERVVETRFGPALFNDTYSAIWNLNVLRAERAGEATAAEIAAEADRVQANLGHRRVILPAGARRLENGFRELGWEGDHFLFMVYRGDPQERVDTTRVEEVDPTRLTRLRREIVHEWASQEDGEKGSLLDPRDRNRPAVAGNLERPQDLEVHALSPGPSYHGLRAPQNGRFARVTGG